ncbi:hypothetical protein [Ruminococcus albus]|uniref:hypothetical protein n=1 Tax=Ruminococcus albus TaxID=1264 RepID=UPI00046309C7|nr:hypothetical protein [Ruminococcus albus]
MMRYLRIRLSEETVCHHFDNWVSVFGEQKTEWEAETWRAMASRNVHALRTTQVCQSSWSMFKQIADIRTADTLKLDVPRSVNIM